MTKSEQIAELAKAMVKVQAALKPALKDSKNPFFQSKYADLESVWEACRAPLIENGISVIQTMAFENGTDILETILLHTSGQYLTSRLRIAPIKPDPQAMGSAITYARRYALAALIGVVQADDDGEAAMERKIAYKPNVKESRPSGIDSPMALAHAEADRLEQEMQDMPINCALCNEPLKRTKANNAWFCPNYKDKSNGEHSYIKD